VGLAGSANIGDEVSMFEAIHGSAPRRAGQDLANPSGLLLGAVQMLIHIGQADAATRVHNAWLRTIEDGVHTYDIFDETQSSQKVGTSAFADAVVARIGERPQTLAAVDYEASDPITIKLAERAAPTKVQVGVDVFVDQPGVRPDDLATRLLPMAGEFALDMITNRGQKVWPGGAAETLCTDHWRCRFLMRDGKSTTAMAVAQLQCRLAEHGINPIKTEGLFTFDGEPGFSKGQGQ
jgi:isocitrate dehydrogenase